MAMTDRKLMELAKQHYEASRAEKEAKAAKENAKTKAVKELKGRGLKALIAMGWKLTLVTPTETKYNIAKARTVLPRETFNAITTRVVDADKVNAALANKTLTPKQLAKFATRVDKSSYISVTPSETGGE